MTLLNLHNIKGDNFLWQNQKFTTEMYHVDMIFIIYIFDQEYVFYNLFVAASQRCDFGVKSSVGSLWKCKDCSQ